MAPPLARGARRRTRFLVLGALAVLGIVYRLQALSSLTASSPAAVSLDPSSVRRLRAEQLRALPSGASSAEPTIGGACTDVRLPFDALRTQPMREAAQSDVAVAAAATAGAGCHAAAHTELEGSVVLWGASHVLASPAQCCDACRAHAAAAKPCNVWVWCSEEGGCGSQKHGECWLKHATDTEAPRRVKAAGAHVGWVSGSLFPPAAAKRAPPAGPLSEGPLADGLELMRAGGFELGLRASTGSVELLAPLSARAFSFVLPLRDASLRLGRPTDPAFDRRERQYAHLGDANFRICQGGVPRPTAPPAEAGAEGSHAGEEDGVVLPDGACARSRLFSTGVRRGQPGASSEPAAMPTAAPSAGLPSAPSARLLLSRDLTALLPADSPLRLTFWLEAVPLSAGGASAAGGTDEAQARAAADEAAAAGDADAAASGEEVQLWWQLEAKRPGEPGALPEEQAVAGIVVGSLGLPLPFNQYFSFQSLEAVASKCSFAEAYPGLHAGYVQVTRARGQGPVLLVLPARHHGGGAAAAGASAAVGGRPFSRFEAWRPLREADRLDPNYMYENSHELLLHSAAYAQQEWRKADPWNQPTAAIVRPGRPLRRGLRLRLAASVDSVEAALHFAGVPVAVPMPAPTLTTEMHGAALWVRTPPSLQLRPELSRTTPPGCVAVGPLAEPIRRGAATAGWAAYRMRADAAVGRCRLDLAFAPRAAPAQTEAAQQVAQQGPAQPLTVQSVHLFVARPARQLVAQMAAVANTVGWLGPEVNDPWDRTPAYFGTDMEARKPVLEQPKVFMAGLSDEAGLAMPLAMAAKQLGLASAEEVARLEAMVHGTFLSPANSSARERHRFLQSGADWGVRRSMLFWSDSLNANQTVAKLAPELYAACHRCWPKCWWLICWGEETSAATWRAYNYPHVAATYWALHRAASRRVPALATMREGEFYLEAAARTALGMWTHGGRLGGLAQWGLMGATVFVLILRDVQAAISEAQHAVDARALGRWVALEAKLRSAMAQRVTKWRSLAFPFGSEFPWDSTGYEEVHAWLTAFGRRDEAASTAQSILAFVTLSPHWAFSGSARRYWDFGINGKLNIGNEREIHHYAATLNALPLVAEYEANPSRAVLLRIGAAATLGSLTVVDPETGFVSMAWHGDPALLSRDPYSADFGVGFLGATLLSRATVAWHEPFGWLCVLCDFSAEGPLGETMHHATLDAPPPTPAEPLPRVDVVLRDAYRRRLFLAPLGLLASAEGAAIVRARLRKPHGCVRLELQAEPVGTLRASLEFELTATRAEPLGSLGVRCCSAGGQQCVRRATFAATPARLEVELGGGGAAKVDVCWS